jgi:hypothetical protein
MVGPRIANTSVADRRGGYTVEAREMRIGDSRCPDVVDFGDIEPSSGSIRGRDGYRKYVSWLVAGGATSFIAITPLKFRRLQPAPPPRGDLACDGERPASGAHEERAGPYRAP